jgi:hypothetical protein
MVLLSRMLNFYPEIIASFVLASAAAAWAIRSRTPWSMLWAGLGIGVVLLMDVRGLMWALPLFGGVALAALLGKQQEYGTGRANPLLLLSSLCLPIVISYLLGDWAYPDNTTTLEQQVDLRLLFNTHGATGSEFLPTYDDYDTHFRWGRSAIQEIPLTLWFLLEQARFQAPEGLTTIAGVGSSEQHIKPWMLLGGLGLMGAIAVLRSPQLAALGTLLHALSFCYRTPRDGCGEGDAAPNSHTLDARACPLARSGFCRCPPTPGASGLSRVEVEGPELALTGGQPGCGSVRDPAAAGRRH